MHVCLTRSCHRDVPYLGGWLKGEGCQARWKVKDDVISRKGSD